MCVNLSKMDTYQMEPLNLTSVSLNESVKSTVDLCTDCQSKFCIVKKLQDEQARFECRTCRKTYKVLSSKTLFPRIHYFVVNFVLNYFLLNKH